MNRQRHVWTGLLGLALLFWASVALAAGAGSYTVPWSALSSGGAPVKAGVYALESTFGQAAAGPLQTGVLALCAGYQCAPPGSQAYLPTVLRD